MSELDPRAIIAREPMHFRQVIAIGIATALNALDGFDVLSISFAAPGIARDWGIDRAALGLVLSMELIGMGIGALILGAMADRIGRAEVAAAPLGSCSLSLSEADAAPKSPIVLKNDHREPPPVNFIPVGHAQTKHNKEGKKRAKSEFLLCGPPGAYPRIEPRCLYI